MAVMSVLAISVSMAIHIYQPDVVISMNVINQMHVGKMLNVQMLLEALNVDACLVSQDNQNDFVKVSLDPLPLILPSYFSFIVTNSKSISKCITYLKLSVLDVNECSKNPCDSNAVCQNTPGSFICKCRPGFRGDPYNGCVDINECSKDVCGQFSICENIPGSYRCQCPEGFRRSSDSACERGTI